MWENSGAFSCPLRICFTWMNCRRSLNDQVGLLPPAVEGHQLGRWKDYTILENMPHLLKKIVYLWPLQVYLCVWRGVHEWVRISVTHGYVYVCEYMFMDLCGLWTCVYVCVYVCHCDFWVCVCSSVYPSLGWVQVCERMWCVVSVFVTSVRYVSLYRFTAVYIKM